MNGGSQHPVAYLQLVQGVIGRMAGNSARMKTWAVFRTSAAYAVSGVSAGPHWLIGAGGAMRPFVHKGTSSPVIPIAAPMPLQSSPVWRAAWSVCLFCGALPMVIAALVMILVMTGA